MTLFDATYYGITGGLAVVLAAVVFGAGRLRSRLGDSAGRVHAEALLLAATGAELALVAGVTLNLLAPLTGDLFYQRSHFAIFYIGFGAVLLGLVRASLGGSDANKPPSIRMKSALVGVLGLTYLGAVLISAVALGSTRAPATAGGHVPQQTVFFLPVFLGLASSVGAGTVFAITSRVGWTRTFLAGLTAFAALSLVGFLREANVIPSSGQPMLDLLVAFGPLGLAAVSLCMSLFAIGRFSSRNFVPASASDERIVLMSQKPAER